MARFKGAVLNCVVCDAEFRVPPVRANTAKACSHECAKSVRAKSNERKELLVCKTCGKEKWMPRCHARRQTYCSKACAEASPEVKAFRASRTGDKNSAWKGGSTKRKDRYTNARAPGHPFAQNGYVLEHRLVMERWLNENDPESLFLIEIGVQKYLSPDYIVHHRDLGRTNNGIENLECMTAQDHRRLHNEIARKAMAYYREHVILKQGEES